MNRRLREAHAHIASHGQSLTMPTLDACDGAEAMLEIVRTNARSVKSGGWLRLIGARVEAWTAPGNGPSGWPTLDELDAATGNVPCAAMSFDHHMVMCNSAALAGAKIDASSIAPPGGIIGRTASGVPNGLLLETAAWSAWSYAPEPSPAERSHQVIAALNDLARLGFVEVHDMFSQPWLGPLLAELSDAGRLPMRVWLYAPIDQLRGLAASKPSWERPDVTLAGGKIFVDGTLNSRTAWVLEPYREPQDDLPTGKIVTPPGEIRDAIRLCDSLGIGLAAHAIGDAAVRAVLDAAESVIDSHERDARRLASGLMKVRDVAGMGAATIDAPLVRIEHAEVIDAADIPRFSDLGVVASVQPCHLLADIEALRRYLPHRLDRVLPLRELADAGMLPGQGLWFGSDTPIVRPDPSDSIQAAVARRRAGMEQGESIGWHQRLSEVEAWRAFAAP